MKVLEPAQIDRLLDALETTDVYDLRNVLMPDSWRARVTTVNKPVAQLVADLQWLQEQTRPGDDGLPFIHWLRSARRLVSPRRPELVTLFDELLSACEGFLARTATPLPALPTPRYDTLTVRITPTARGHRAEYFVDGRPFQAVPSLDGDWRFLTTATGTDLFDALFPRAGRAALFRELLGSEHAERAQLRVRVLAPPHVRNLRWADATIGKTLLRALPGWTFEHAVDIAPGFPQVNWPTDGAVLVLADEDTRALVEDIRDALGNCRMAYRADGHFVIVDEPSRYRQALEDHPASAVAVLTTDSTGAEALAERSRPEEGRARAAWIRCTRPQPPTLPSRLLECFAAVTVVHADDDRVGARHLDEWLQSLVVHGQDPVTASYRSPSTLVAPIACWEVHTSFGTWQATPSDLPEFRHPSIGLDRWEQRGRALERVTAICRGRDARGLALVAVAAHGNRVEQVGAHILEHINAQDAQPIVNRLAVGLPGAFAPPARFAEGLEHALRDALGLGSTATETEIAAGLRRMAPAATDRTPVIWLDFGTPPTAERFDVTTWLATAKRWVSTPTFPPELRLVAFVAIETTAFESVRSAVREAAKAAPVTFSTEMLKPLESVEEEHLIQYFQEEGTTSLPREEAGAMAELIFARTQGAYDATTDLIHEGEKQGWAKLRRKLKKPTSPERQD